MEQIGLGLLIIGTMLMCVSFAVVCAYWGEEAPEDAEEFIINTGVFAGALFASGVALMVLP